MMNEDDVNQNASKGEADSGAGASSTALRKIEGGAGKTALAVQKPQPTGKVKADDLKFMHDLQGALIAQKTPFSMIMLYTITMVVVVALVWAHFARVEEITRGDGKVIPASREQLIQSLEGGILEELNVQEGDIVEKGQILLKIDPTRAGASYGESLSKVQGLKGSIARLRAEAYDTPLTFPPEIAGIESIVRDETQAYNARLKTLNESVQALQRSLALAQNEVSLSEPLARKGLMSDVEILRLKRQANEFSLQIAERTNRFRSDANSELNRLESELAQAEEILRGRQDVMNRTTVVAPVRGTVHVTAHGTVFIQYQRVNPLLVTDNRNVRRDIVIHQSPGIIAHHADDGHVGIVHQQSIFTHGFIFHHRVVVGRRHVGIVINAHFRIVFQMKIIKRRHNGIL